jgi:hypothetical protein
MARATLVVGMSAAALAAFAAANGQEAALSKPLALTGDQIRYTAMINSPPGVLSAVPVGDMLAPGIYVLRNRFPPLYQIPAHKHGEWRVMTVIEGTVKFAYGDTFDEQSLRPFGPGSLILEPANVYHYFTIGEEGAVLQFVAQGPLTAEFAPSVQAEAPPTPRP